MIETKRKKFLEEDIVKLLFQFSAPASLGMLIISFCAVIDSIFVGRFIGTDGLAVLTLILPIFMLFSAAANTIGIGASAIWSIEMGALNTSRANKTFAHAVMLSSFIGILMAILGTFFMDFILFLFGTPQNILPMAQEYVFIFMLGSPFLLIIITLNSFIRAEGRPVISMLMLMLVAVLNILFDYLLIVKLKIGISGAAIAMIGSNFVVFLWIIFYFIFKHSSIRPPLNAFKPSFNITKDILTTGFAAFLRQIGIGIMHFSYVISIAWYAGSYSSIYLAICGISMRCLMMVLLPVIGIFQGMQPIVGFNYGAQQYLRAKTTAILSITASFSLGLIAWFILMFFPENILEVFSNDPELISNGTSIIRIIVLAVPFLAAQNTAAGLFQILKKPVSASIFAILRQLLLFLPAILILPHFFGVNGIWYAAPFADILAFTITIIWVNKELNELKRLDEAQNGVTIKSI